MCAILQCSGNVDPARSDARRQWVGAAARALQSWGNFAAPLMWL
jgi:hypothetical protein